MLRWIVVSSVLAGIVGVASVALIKARSPRVQVESREIDFQAVAPKSPVQRVLWVSNTGGRELHLLSVQSNCYCTRATLHQSTIAPGDSVPMTVDFTPPSRGGAMLNQILIRTNDPQAPEVIVNVRAHVVPEVRVVPSVLDFGLIEQKDLPMPKGRSAVLSGTDQAPITIRAIRPSSPWIDVHVTDVRDRETGLVVGLTAGTPIGVIEGHIAVEYSTAGGESKRLSVPLAGQVVGDVLVRPSSVVLMPNSALADSRVRIASKRGGHLEIEERSIDPAVKGLIDVEYQQAAGGIDLVVRMRNEPSAEQGSRRETVRGSIVLTVRVSADGNGRGESAGAGTVNQKAATCQVAVPVVLARAASGDGEWGAEEEAANVPWQ